MGQGRLGDKARDAVVRRLLVEAVMRLTPEARGAGIEPSHLVSGRIIEKASEAGEAGLESVLEEIAEAARLIHGLATGGARGNRALESLERLAAILGREDYEVVVDLLARRARSIGSVVADAPLGFRVEPKTFLTVESTDVSLRLGYETPEGGVVVYTTPARAGRFTASFYVPQGERGPLEGTLVFDLRDGVSRLIIVPTPSMKGREARVYYGALGASARLPRISDYVKVNIGLAELLSESRAYWLDGSRLFIARSVAFSVDFPTRFHHGPANPAPASRIMASAAGKTVEYAILGISDDGRPVMGLPGLGYVSLPPLPEGGEDRFRVVEHFSIRLPLATQPEALAEAARPLKGAVGVSGDGVLELAGLDGDDLALYMAGPVGFRPGSGYTGDLHDFTSEALAAWRAFRAVLAGFDASHAYIAGEPVLEAGGGFEGLLARARERAADACIHGRILAEGRGPVKGVSAPLEGILRVELADGSAVQLTGVEASDQVWLTPKLGSPEGVKVVQRGDRIYLCLKGGEGRIVVLAARGHD